MAPITPPPAALVADRNLMHLHPLTRARWLILQNRLRDKYGLLTLLVEGFRPDVRQQWLWAQGRTAAQCQAKGIPEDWARPGPMVTNAWNCLTSAHGLVLNGSPASAAVDICPLGPDGRPYTADDPWDGFLRATAVEGHVVGLVHFTSHGVITDRPHLQLVEWSDTTHGLNPA